MVELMSFTSNFLESNKIGSGGCGKVYKGQLPNGILIAVKVLEIMDVGEDTFMAEVGAMGKARHLNLIKLYGYCFEDNMKALMYEYMQNGSLDKILYGNNHGRSIEWVKLYDIAIGIANGLKYLHHDLEEQIIHYDIKAANVLLGKNFSAKLADFGLAKTMKRDVSCVDVSKIRGTYSYIAPEIYTPGSQVSRKCDVYNFGMMLFEILGKRSNGVEENWFPKIVWKQFENGNLEHFIRTNCGIAEKDKENANILCKVALWCVQYNPDLRPSMKDVVLMLEKEKLVKDPPCPSFEFREWSDEMELDPTYLRNITVGPTYESVGGSDGEAALSQLKSNKHKTRSPYVLEENLDTLVPNKGMKLPTTILVGKTTARKYKEIILQLIAKDEAVTIGVYGMGGAGKTTIFKHIHNQLLAEPNRFDKIIWVTVSKDGNTTKLQNDLAKELDLNLSCEDNVLRRSRLLFQALEKRKRVVFFFDDMWKKISLDEIGIPEPTQENGFKLILTTRLLEVCETMGCHEDSTIKVEPLQEDEAWELFMKKVDHVFSPEVMKIAKMIAKKCSGLPLAIITVGATMRRNSDINKWTVALEDLNLKDPKNRTMDMEDNVYKYWKIATRDLVEFWIMDGLVEGRNKQDELVKSQFILNKLKDHCLLESIDIVDEYNVWSDGVKMHDLIREMALRLTNKCFMVQYGSCLKELPKENEWKICLERASFMDSGIVAISISPICPKLSTLILGGCFLESVTHNFFVHMKCLKVLDLRWCDYQLHNYHLELLPDSISDLVNLRALRLSRMKRLKKLPSLAKLVLLRKFELNGTGIEELPQGMEMLVNLKCLNLHGVQLKERIPIGLISKLSALEELYLGGIEMDKLYDIGSGECFTKELLSLKKLEILNVSVHCLSDYASYVGSSEFNGLKYLYLTIGEVFLDLHYYVDDEPFNDEPFVHQNTNHIDMTSLNMFGLLKDVRELILITIRGGNKIECIWSSKDENQEFSATGTSSSCWLQSLQEISIDGCTKLYTIFEGIPNYTSGVLPVFCLKKLEIFRCRNLKNVFPSSRLLQLLQNLENITIYCWDELEELIGDDEEEETPIAIPKLEALQIWDLPKLKRIWRGVMICDSLKYVMVGKCSQLRRLPRIIGEEKSTPPPALRNIHGSREWWGSLEWDRAYPKYILEPYFFEEEEEEEDNLEPQSNGEDSKMSEGEKSSQSDECAPEGVVLGREKIFQLDPNVPVGYVCHNCEMCAIVEMRYRCKDCWEKCIAAEILSSLREA